MKTLIFLVLIFTYVHLNAQDERVYELDAQNTFVDSANVLIDDSSNLVDYTKRQRASILAPRIQHLNETSSLLDGTSTYMRWSNGSSNTEYKSQLQYFAPKVFELTAKPVPLAGTDYFGISSGSVEYKMLASAVATYITGTSTFNSAVDARFGNSTFNSSVYSIRPLIVNLTTDNTALETGDWIPFYDIIAGIERKANPAYVIDARFGNATFDSEVDDYITESYLEGKMEVSGNRTLVVGAVQLGTMYYSHIGKMVTGAIFVQNGGTGDATVALTSALRPVVNVAFQYTLDDPGSDFPRNFILFKSDGTITMDFEAGWGSGDYSFGFSWVTP